ncbi:hypothetical protein K469DRAFT_201370 [Zopfia rhizophila CBS 207.26]|uniref:DUF7730 domain-containing protein n=1 Tax=Zopfia rhizophila CBS 207.26 TaxID=1314779 RepID=A0A6A6DVU1_9PEZI|nr:hypothetical protein K469DRAFT_201370 [Zopfia rhizophila CBS 207.26]
MTDQNWEQWILSLPRNTIIKSWKLLAVQPYSYCATTLKHWTRQNKHPKLAYAPKRSHRTPPLPLPARRKRALSISKVENPNIFKKLIPRYQRTSSQSQCLLLTKLPPEIRNQIWGLVLGDRALHIIPSLVPSQTRPSKYTLKDKKLVYRLDYEPCKWSTEGLDYAVTGLGSAHSACAIWINSNGELYFNAPQAVVNGERDLEVRFLRW